MTPTTDLRIRDEIRGADAHRSNVVRIPTVTPQQAWELFSDTDLVKRFGNEPRVAFRRIPVRPGLALRHATTSEANPMKYEEDHYEWDEGRWFAGRMRFLDGPLAQMMIFFSFTVVDGQSQVEMAAGVWVKDPAQRSLAEEVANGLVADHLTRTPSRIVVNADPPTPLLELNERPEFDEVLLKASERALLDCGESQPGVERLARTIATRPDHELFALEPRLLADRWRLDRSALIDLFLRAARIQLLEPQWSVLCPSCRGPKAATSDIARTAGGAHCEDCNITFEADPTTNLQLAFRPVPAIRKLDEQWYCVAGPARTRHVKAQAYVAPGRRQTLTIADAAAMAACRLRCPALGVAVDLPAEHGLWRLGAGGFTRTSEAAEGIEVVNETSERLRVLIEQRALPDSVLRADEVLAAPRFRELFRADQWEFLAAMERSWRASFDVAEARPRERPPTEPYDLVVIGSGPGGEAAALRAAQLGRRVAVVEARRTFGGPSGLGSKAFREAALKVLDWSRATSATGEHVKPMFAERFAHLRRYVITLQSHEVLRRLGRARIDLYYGFASLSGAERVRVVRPAEEAALELNTRHVIIATGSRPARPAEIPFDGALVLDADDMNELRSLPNRMCLIGFGVIGCEYASLLVALGVQVTVIHTKGPVLPMLDRELAESFSAQLAGKGVQIVTGAAVARVETRPGASDPVQVHLDTGAVIACDQVLYAMGRDAASAGLELATAGMAAGKYGRVEADRAGRTTHPTVLAVGDVTGPPGLANAAVQQGRSAVELLFGKGSGDPVGTAAQATTLWTLPELAGVGLTEAEAKARGVDFVTGYGRFRDLPRGIMAGDLDGWAKVLVERSTQRILGAHVIGDSACDLIQHALPMIRDGKTAVEVAESGFSAGTFHNLYEMAARDALDRAG